MPTPRARLRLLLLLPSDVIRNLFVIPLMSLGFVARWFISLFIMASEWPCQSQIL
jgi:hypothetical protein